MPEKKKIGMYGETPRIKVGKFTICRMCPDGEDNSVWIEFADGEGAEFSDELFEEAIASFYAKHF